MRPLAALVLSLSLCLSPCMLPGLALAAGQVHDPSQPPPKGFRFHDHAPTKCRFLVPDGWHVQESTHEGGVLQVTISKEPAPPESTRIQTAFTVHVFGRPQDRKADGAAMIRSWVGSLKALPGAQVQTSLSTLGPFTGVSIMGRFPAGTSPGAPAFRLAGFGFENSETGAVYAIRMEIPEAEVDGNAAIAETLVRGMVLETEY